MSPNCIQFINVTKEYPLGNGKKSVALNNLSLTIRQGDFAALIGLNGSGKSTVARLINGLIQPTSGTVLVNGLSTTDQNSLLEIRRLVGMVFQNPDNQIISTIVEEDISFGPENLGLPAAEVRARTEWALTALDIENLRRHAPHLLSGGQKQRVAIASALALRPAYLILDEPTSMLDYAGKQELMKTLAHLNDQYGLTIILITHHLEDTLPANRLLVLDQGALFCEGTPAAIFAAPEEINRLGFPTPDIIRLTANLRDRGHHLPSNLLTADRLVESLCRS